MKDLENIENVEEVEVIPTDSTTEELQENVEETSTVPEDNTAEIEAEQERLRREHEEYLNSFPDTTVFYREIIERDDGTKALGMPTHSSRQAESWGYLEQHYDESELTYIGTPECGIWYLIGHEPAEETREEMIDRRQTEIVNMVQNIIDETAQQKRYDDGLSCVSYEGDPDPEFNLDAVAFKAWRGRCWRTCYNILNSVKAGTVAPEDVTDAYVIERLPVMEWPEV